MLKFSLFLIGVSAWSNFKSSQPVKPCESREFRPAYCEEGFPQDDSHNRELKMLVFSKSECFADQIGVCPEFQGYMWI